MEQITEAERSWFTQNVTFREAVKDAGLLREYLAIHYGQMFRYGGSFDAWHRGVRIAGLLARMIGASRDEVISITRSDAEQIFEEDN